MECPSIPGCVSQGKTREQALKNIEDAMSLCLDVRAERGKPLMLETRPVNDAAILAEPSLTPGWLGPDADEAWKHLNELPEISTIEIIRRS